ncbi:MAG: signal recognition particle-docking protein FtsY [Acidobacteria bacterium]|nr:MAG: signal recognition particle-docking protein FtsY [Acidobacteriota bacterium]
MVAAIAIVGSRRRARRRGQVSRSSAPPLQAPAVPKVAPPPQSAPLAEAPPAIEPAEAPPVERVEPAEAPPVEEEISPKKRFRDRLARARGTFSSALSSMLSRKAIDEETWEDLEEALVRCDVGIDLTQQILQDLEARAKAEGVKDPDGIITLLKDELESLLAGQDRSLVANGDSLTTWLMVGVNGVGKTTTIAKLAKRNVDAGKSVVLAAGDTFRAAAAEQLQVWGERTGAEVIRGQEGADPASVVYDATDAARARHADLLIVDTAGRLHTKVNLMEELKKVRRVIEKAGGGLTETLLVIDATTGQNGLSQARQFSEAVDVTGIVLTKLDGSARGGIVVAVERELGIPVKLVGLGEGASDLMEFEPRYFVDALFE